MSLQSRLKYRTSPLWAVVFVAFLCGLQPAWGQNRDFETPTQKVTFLGHLRAHYPNLYQDFVIRYNPFAFLGTAQEAINQVKFSTQSIPGLGFTVFETSAGEFAEGVVDEKLFAAAMRNFVQNYSDSSLPLVHALVGEMKKEAALDGLMAGLMQSRAIPNVREIMQRPEAERIALLESALRALPKIPGLDPRRIGLVQDSLSGAEFVELYKQALEGKRNTLRLVWLAVLAQESGSLNQSVAQIARSIENRRSESLSRSFTTEAYRETTENLLRAIEAAAPQTLNTNKVRKAFKDSYAELKATAMREAELAKRAVLTAMRTHPYDTWPRGSVGDCSTFNSFGIPMARGEEVYYLFKPGTKIVKGYLQYTRVRVDKRDVLYVNTISGADLSKADVRYALHGLAASLPELGAASIVIPVPEKFFDIINFPEVSAVLQELVEKGRRVKLEYLDGDDRKALAPFTEGQLDLPETNLEGIEIPVEALAVQGLQTKTSKVEIRTSDRFKKLTPMEALFVALDLRSRQDREINVDEIVRLFQIDAKKFNDLWATLENRERSSVEDFHRRVQAKLESMSIQVEWREFVRSPFMFTGHFASSDALTGAHFKISMHHIETYLLSYSNMEHVYSTLSPLMPQLVQRPEFMKVIRSLFRKNMNEFNRTLDFYELEQRSAYRTLINLFQAGLPVASFQNELRELDQFENKGLDASQVDAASVRRLTFLSTISGFQPAYHNKLIGYLTEMAQSGRFLGIDDIRAMGYYFSTYMENERTSQADVDRIFRFLTSSPFGLSLTSTIGMYKIDRLDVPTLFNILLSVQKPLWAAYLIHKPVWASHQLAPVWANALWENREAIGHDSFLQALTLGPQWLKVPGTEKVVDWLMPLSKGNIGQETSMVRILLKEPSKLTQARLNWLANVSSAGLAEMIADSMKTGWSQKQIQYLQKPLVQRFPELKSQLPVVSPASRPTIQPVKTPTNRSKAMSCEALFGT